jgi:ABC-type glycerol-3-phosphate transport system permease component
MAEREDDLHSGYGSLKQGWSGWIVFLHVLLMVAGFLFLLPLLWMTSTSLKPLDQTMSLPPTWIPRATLAPLDGKETMVVKEQRVAEESVIVQVEEGGAQGQRRLLPRKAVDAASRAWIKVARGGREEYEDKPARVTIVRQVPAGWWKVIEWKPEFSAEREKTKTELRWDCVAESELKAVPHAFFSNYASVMTRMRQKDDPPEWYAAGLPRYLLNTLWVCFFSVVGVVVSCTLVAYAFAFL